MCLAQGGGPVYCVLLLLVIIITAVVVLNYPIACILCKLPQTLSGVS